MRDLPVYLATAGFFVMGVGTLTTPRAVTPQSAILHLTSAGRNGVRAMVSQCTDMWPLRGLSPNPSWQAQCQTDH